MTRLALLVLAGWIVAAIAGAVQSEPEISLANALLAPGPGQWLGSDPLGKPVADLLLGGAMTALVIGLSTVVVAGSFGVLLGAVAGLAGRRIDMVVMRIVDVLLAFPGILLAIAITAVLGPSTLNIILALTVLGWTGFARLARGQTLQLKEQAFVSAAICQGSSSTRVVLRHILPNLAGPVMVQATFAVAGTILAESSLSFLGLGDPTQPSWGALLADGVRYLRDAPHLSILPGLAISLVVLSLNIVGDAWTDQLDPRNNG